MQNVAIKLGKFILIAPVLSILLYSACGSFNLDVTLKSEKQIDQRYYYFNDSLFRDVDTSLTNYRIIFTSITFLVFYADTQKKVFIMIA